LLTHGHRERKRKEGKKIEREGRREGGRETEATIRNYEDYL